MAFLRFRVEPDSLLVLIGPGPYGHGGTGSVRGHFAFPARLGLWRAGVRAGRRLGSGGDWRRRAGLSVEALEPLDENRDARFSAVAETMESEPATVEERSATRSASCANVARVEKRNGDASAPNAADFVAIEIQSEQPQGAAAQQDELNKGATLDKIDAAAVATTVQAAEKESLAEEDGKVCRVCHLSLPARSSDTGSLEPDNRSMEAIELGCNCKEDLSVAHRRCAQTWFKIKGNRTCEICGQPAHNVPAVAGGLGSDDYSCGRRSDEQSLTGEASRGANSDPRSFWHHRPICNFVLAFVVVILLLPWLFRIRLF